MMSVYQWYTINKIRVLRWKYHNLGHTGEFTRELQRAAARGKGWA